MISDELKETLETEKVILDISEKVSEAWAKSLDKKLRRNTEVDNMDNTHDNRDKFRSFVKQKCG